MSMRSFFCVVFVLIGLLCRVAAKLRLLVPLLYACIVGIGFHQWAADNEALSIGIFAAMVALAALSWVVTLVRKIRGVI